MLNDYPSHAQIRFLQPLTAIRSATHCFFHASPAVVVVADRCGCTFSPKVASPATWRETESFQISRLNASSPDLTRALRKPGRYLTSYSCLCTNTNTNSRIAGRLGVRLAEVAFTVEQARGPSF